jgi:DNA-directed RNA polymerase beta' subunit
MLESVPIKSKKRIDKPNKVYNIEVEENHNYFANGLLVGNSHITLAEPTVNPIFAGSRQIPGPAVVLSGLKWKEFDDVMHGNHTVNGLTGGPAIKHLLDKVDVKKELDNTLKDLKTAKGAELNSLNRKAKYLRALDKLGMKPSDAYIINHVPVLPPIYRPITPMEDGSISSADINELYGLLIQDNNALKRLPKELPNSEKNRYRGAIYDSLKAVAGMGSVPTYEGNKKLKGILQTIAGDSPKMGFFQSKIMKRRQELSMRSTITPAPEMSLDQVGIPRDAAMDLYKPFVVRELIKGGKDIIDAQKEIKERSPTAQKALEIAVAQRPVLLKRDPVLHKYNVQAFFPKLVEGNSIKIHPLVCSGFNSDFDGDSVLGKVIVATSEKTWYKDSMPLTNTPILSIQNIDIAQFPRLESSINMKEKCIEYDVPEGTFVPSYTNGEIKWAPVTKFSIHPNCEEWITKTKLGREIISSGDHSLAVLDEETLEVVKSKPCDSLNKCIPVFRGNYSNHLIEELPGVKIEHEKANYKPYEMLPIIKLTESIGWFIGATIGDGWVSHSGTSTRGVALSSGCDDLDVLNYWSAIAENICAAKRIVQNLPHEFEGKPANSMRSMINCAALGKWLEPLIGCGAANKHLPPGFLSMPVEFRQGLFCGLIDTDGTSCWNARPQYSLTFHTTSRLLADEFSLLSLSLGLVPSITEYVNRDKPAYIITISIRTAQNARWIRLIRKDKMEAITKLWEHEAVEWGREDFVPLPEEARVQLLQLMRILGATKKGINKNKEAFSQYVVLNRKLPVITRSSVDRLVAITSNLEKSPYLQKWFAIVCNPLVGWDVIDAVTTTGELKTMYDITVPDSWTFCMADGAVVWDTMAAYLPITEEARKEAIEKMLPSKNLFSLTNYGIMHAPDQEAVMGLHYLSKWGNKTDKKYGSIEAARNDSALHINDVITVNGKETTKGRLILTQKLPDKFKTDEILYDPNFRVKKKWLYKTLEGIAHHDQKAYPEIVDHLKDAGNKYAYEHGLTFSLKDIHPLPEKRDAVLKPFHAEADAVDKDSKLTKEQKDAKKVEIYTRATEEMDKQLHPEFKKMNNNIYLSAIEVGGKGSAASVRQMLEAPMLLRDANNTIVPTPVTRSYAEGLTVAQYFTALHGARKGTLQKVEGTQEPGKLTKQIVNLNINTLITEPDCRSDKGISLSIKEPDVIERYTAKPITLGAQTIPAGTHITPELVGQLGKHGHTHVDVRSPLNCHSENGICQKCIGHGADGRPHEIGTNIGVIASQAIGEPAIQLALDSFHSGGVAASRGGASVDRIKRLGQLLNMPKQLPGSAVLAEKAGKIEHIEKDPTTNGHYIHIDGQKHYAQANKELAVKVGDHVSMGDKLTHGPINPHHLLPLKGVEAVRHYLADELSTVVAKEGVRRRNIEVVTKNLTGLAQVRDAGSSHWLIGDIVPITELDKHNKQVKQSENKIVYRHIIKGADDASPFKSPDVLDRINFESIQREIVGAAGTLGGWKQHGLNPITNIAMSSVTSNNKPNY